MRKFKLKNGLTVIVEQRKSDVVVIEVCVHTGSNNETGNVAGMSHFLEHMVFEGTKTRSAKQISEIIENVGGELNAATGNERTFYYAVLPKQKALLGLEVLSDIFANPVFDMKILEKERKVVLEELKMVNDQPAIYQWIFFQRSLFRKHPSRNPPYGKIHSIKAITRAQMLGYFRKWYVPDNMTITLVGDVKSLVPKLGRYFGVLPRRRAPGFRSVAEPAETRPRMFREFRKINQSYVMLGYKTVPRMHRDSVVLDVISAVFAKGLSGRVTNEIRIKRGLAYVVGAEHETKKDYGFFAFYLNTEKKNVDTCKGLILDEIRKLSDLGKLELDQAKDNIIGNTLIRNEDPRRRADSLAFWEFIGDAKMSGEYLKKVRKVTVKDIIRVRNKYFKDNYTMIRLESR
jgi:zinc protease